MSGGAAGRQAGHAAGPGPRHGDGDAAAGPGHGHPVDRPGDHAGHDHAGHDHAGHDHAGHGQSGPAHPGPAHPGHDHAGHDHAGRGHADHGPGGHRHGPSPGEAGFVPAIAANLGFVVAELLAGLVAGSMALVADAGHNLSDVLGLGLAWIAARLASRPASPRRTYGLQRGTILAALANAALLLVAVGAIALESIARLLTPAPVATGWMLWVALAGVAVNAGTAMLFMRGREADLNRRGAFLHLAGDAAVSGGVVAGALLIGWTGWLWVHPALGLLIAGVILASGWGLMRDSVDLALDAVPRGIDPAAVRALIAAQPGVAAVHDLHIWALGTTTVALTAHVERPGNGPDDAFLAETAAALKARFGIEHTTLQVGHGPPAQPCAVALAPAGARQI